MTKAGALEGLLAASRKQAQRRSQRPSTAHCVLEILQSDADAGDVLRGVGVREAELVSALRVVGEEHDLVLERVTDRALKLARHHEPGGAPLVRPLHFLLAITSEPRSTAAQAFERLGVSLGRLQADLVARIAPGEPPARASEPPPRPARTFLASRAQERSIDLQRGPSLARSAEPRSTAQPYTTGEPRTTGEPQRDLQRQGSRIVAPPRNRRAPREQAARPEAPADTGARAETSAPASRWELDRERFPILAALGRNLTALASSGAIDPVLGRERELEQLTDVLCRRRGNNPLLVGPPGVGKTALVEGLALAIVEAAASVAEGAPSPLGERIVVELSAGALASGTGVRGAMADKLRKLRDEVARSEGKVLLFLDEIHAIVGEPAGPDDIATELKGALARGELACIGATTDAEARKHFDRDPAFARRFSVIHVGEPSADATRRILAGLLPGYERHHGVRYEQAAIDAAVDLTVRFLPERCLPDKAIGVLDLAGSRARRTGAAEVGAAEVARVIADEAHVPVDRLLMRDGERLLALEAHLADRVVGQKAALARVAEALRKGAAGFRGRRPLGTFLFLGTTGVGKTETAKAIAELLFAPGAMSRFDMSEMSESHAVARLFGAPPGYVGHEAGGQLTEAVRRKPYQLILLDEIEKAHPDVLLALLPLLDEGRLTDGRGRTIDFTNTVIVLTSNLGALASAQRPHRASGFDAPDPRELARKEADEREARVLEAARRALPPELWNRIDEPLCFGPLGEEDVVEIGRRMLRAAAKALREERGVELVIDDSAARALAAAGGFDAALGARPMKRTVGRLVESPLATRLLSGGLVRGDRVRVRGRGDQIVFEPIEPATADLSAAE
jgi:ATP-dependent Clp protease ATP-binding subunit ClpC